MTMLSLWSHCSPPHLDGSSCKAQGAYFFAPFSLILFYCFRMLIHACQSQSIASPLGLMSMKVHVPWGLTDGTGKESLGEDSFRYK